MSDDDLDPVLDPVRELLHLVADDGDLAVAAYVAYPLYVLHAIAAEIRDGLRPPRPGNQ